jgi:predicted membrane-bound mannosyltransferase
VLYYGEFYNVSDESVADRPPAYGGWHARLPLPWYFEAMNATVDSTTNRSHLRRERPPVVVAHVSEKTELEVWLGGYVTVKRDLSQPDKTTLFLVRRDRLPDDSAWAERAHNESTQNRPPAPGPEPYPNSKV